MASSPVRMVLKWSVPQGESRPIVSALQALMLSSRAQPGCAGCSLSTEVQKKVVIHYTEEWETESDLTRQLRSDRFAVLLELMERASEYPTVEFALGESIRGLDYAEEVRESRAH